jgi:phosphatidylinositol alpha 1,6-mannosyltransferase
MRVAIVTESFLPDVNGVANCVARVAEHLATRGHHVLVVAPQPASGLPRVAGRFPYSVVRLPSLPLPGYPQVRLALPGRRLQAALREHTPDVVHLASPFVLGARAGAIANRHGFASVAVYQTDIPGYTAAYGIASAEAAAWRRIRAIHDRAGRTLAPSTASATALQDHGVRRVWLWRRGVDTTRFDPAQRSRALRQALAPDGATLVGYVGRLAAEKRVELLAATAKLPGIRLVVVGDGPHRTAVQRALPGAVFLGARHGAQLARIYASLDVFVHTGPYETFGQTIQEALASGVPVVAPAAGGPMDLVQPGRTGTLVPPHDPHAIATAVAELAGDPARRFAYGQAARSQVAGRTWAAVGDELIDHYVGVHSGTLTATPLEVPA